MTLIDKIKKSVEGATALGFLYHAAGEMNELIARAERLPVAFAFLLDSGTIDDVNGRYHERVTLAVMFCDKTEFDFNALENEQIIDRMKVKAYKWLQSLRMSNALRIVAVNNTQRLYDNTTDILTGFAVNITIEDVAGVGECELPQVVIDVDKNGSYDVVGVDKVRVNVVPRLEDLEVTQNGEYLPPTDIDGFRKVSVNVQPTLEELTITQNGEYLPQEGVDGFSKVTARVVPSILVKPYSLNVTNDCIVDGYWAGELIDTSAMVKMTNMFANCSSLQTLDVSGWDTGNVTDMYATFYNCSQLQSLDVSGWDTSKVTTMAQTFSYCKSLQSLDVSDWDTSNVTEMYDTFARCRSLKTLDVSKWDTSKVTTMYSVFLDCNALESIDVSKWDTSNVSGYLTRIFGNCKSLQVIDLSNWDASKVTSTLLLLEGCSKLESIIGNRNVSEVIIYDIAALRGLKVSLSLSGTTNLNRASLRALINGLADLTGKTAQTLTLGAILLAKLTEEDIAIATNKNWTIA